MANPLPVVAPEDLESFSLTRTSSGFALKAFHTSWSAPISVKLLSSQDTTERDWKLLLQDIASVSRCESERLLPPLGIYQCQGLVGIVTEWMNNGSLHSLIHERQLYPEVPFPVLLRILSEVAEGLRHLHSLQPACCHCSLKPSNVLLDVQYRAKISDYGLTNWRKQQLRSDLQNQRNCQDLVYLPPEILEGGLPSQEGDIYSFGIMCWESLSRQKPFEGQTTLLEVLTGICRSLRPGLSEKFIPSTFPERNRLLHLIALCWHQEPAHRPRPAECVDLLNGILTSINKEVISTAIYSLMDAKERALDACKGSEPYRLHTGTCNSEVICPPKNNRLISKKIPFVVPSSSTALLDSSGNNAGRENILEMGLSNTIPQNAKTSKDHPGSESRKPNLFWKIPLSGSAADKQSSQDVAPPLALKHRPQPMYLGQAVTGPCCKGNFCQILTCQRQTILSCMTEGRLNHLLDVLRSRRTLSRTDYETITSYPTVTGRARALLDTCLCLGERAAQGVLTVLSVSKWSPLGQVSHCPDCPSKDIFKIERLQRIKKYFFNRALRKTWTLYSDGNTECCKLSCLLLDFSVDTDALEHPVAAWTHPQVAERLTEFTLEFQLVQDTETLLLSKCSQAQESKISGTANSESKKPATSTNGQNAASPMASTQTCQQLNSNSSYKFDLPHSKQICCSLEPFKPSIGYRDCVSSAQQ